jgi:hypothetical protein
MASNSAQLSGSEKLSKPAGIIMQGEPGDAHEPNNTSEGVNPSRHPNQTTPTPLAVPLDSASPSSAAASPSTPDTAPHPSRESFLSGPELPPKITSSHKLVYLSADAEEELTTLSEDEVYVIGGIVDRNRYTVSAAISSRAPRMLDWATLLLSSQSSSSESSSSQSSSSHQPVLPTFHHIEGSADSSSYARTKPETSVFALLDSPLGPI